MVRRRWRLIPSWTSRDTRRRGRIQGIQAIRRRWGLKPPWTDWDTGSRGRIQIIVKLWGLVLERRKRDGPVVGVNAPWMGFRSAGIRTTSGICRCSVVHVGRHTPLARSVRQRSRARYGWLRSRMYTVVPAATPGAPWARRVICTGSAPAAIGRLDSVVTDPSIVRRSRIRSRRQRRNGITSIAALRLGIRRIAVEEVGLQYGIEQAIIVKDRRPP